MKVGRVACALVALVLATGCSSSSATPAPDAGTHPISEAGADAGGADAGPEGGLDAGLDAAAGEGSTSSYIVIEQNVTSAGDIGDIGIALDPHYPSGLTCARTTSGPCTLDDCAAVDAQDAGTLVDESAGVITLSGGNLGTPLMIGFGAGNRYRPPLIGSPLFDAGALFEVSAPGAAFPAFSGSSAPAPGAITIVTPPLTMGSFGPTYLFDPAAPLAWTWSGGTAGDAVSFTVVSGDVIATCTFDAAAGTGTIPQDVVARFPTSASSIQIVSASSTTLTAGDNSVLFEIASTGSTVYLASQ